MTSQQQDNVARQIQNDVAMSLGQSLIRQIELNAQVVALQQQVAALEAQAASDKTS